MKKNLFSKKLNNKTCNVRNEQSESDHCKFWDKMFNVKTFAILWGFLIGICIIAFFDIRVFASSGVEIESVLPYVPNSNDLALTDAELQILQDYLDQNSCPYNIFEDKCIIFRSSESRWWDYSTYAECELITIYFPQSTSCTSTWSPLTDAENFMFYNSNNYINVTFPDVTWVCSVLKRSGGFGWDYSLGNTIGLSRQFYGSHELIEINNSVEQFSYYQNYPVYTNDIFSTLDPNRYIINFLTYPVAVPTAPTGQAQEPDISGNDIGTDKPDIDDYIPNLPTQPNFDNSTLESMVESLYNWLKWQYGAITDTIKGLIKYLGDTITYSIQKVIDNIKNAISNLYQNFKSLFEPLLNGISDMLFEIKNKLDYISQPFDSSALSDAFEETAIYSDIDSISQLTEDSFGVWSNTSEPNSFAIPLHTEQIYIDGHALTNNTQYIDFGVIDSVKTPIRAVMWCLVTFGLLYTIIDSIPNYIGGNDE